jgi:DNA anti-recombination protein RmuC
VNIEDRLNEKVETLNEALRAMKRLLDIQQEELERLRYRVKELEDERAEKLREATEEIKKIEILRSNRKDSK